MRTTGRGGFTACTAILINNGRATGLAGEDNKVTEEQ